MSTYRCERHGIECQRGEWCRLCIDAYESRGNARQMSLEERACELEWWGSMLTIPMPMFRQRIDELVGRLVWSHELIDPRGLILEIRAQKPATFGQVLAKLPADVPVIVVEMGSTGVEDGPE